MDCPKALFIWIALSLAPGAVCLGSGWSVQSSNSHSNLHGVDYIDANTWIAVGDALEDVIGHPAKEAGPSPNRRPGPWVFTIYEGSECSPAYTAYHGTLSGIRLRSADAA